ncbi:MAG: hypothetical protein JSU77_11330 [Fidelibacterota bacterium]|nr:MAG: hypothetical protein JSU77_11330 [Candidatus Neomarinimicrobiota bacterium]
MLPRPNKSVPYRLSFFLLFGLTLTQSLSALGWRANHLPSSAVALALAGGGTALPGNMTLATVNPAHVWGLEGETVEFGYLRMFGDLRGYGVKWHTLWRARPMQLVLRSTVEEDLEVRNDVPTAEPLAYFSARLLSATLLRGWRLGTTNLGFGITFAHQRMYEYSARGLWLSAGWQGEPLPWLRWSFTLNNLGLGEALFRKRDPVAMRTGVGMAVKTPLRGSYLSLDLWLDRQQGLVPCLAWQGSGQIVRFIAGARWKTGIPLMTAGFQLTYHRWIISYAYGYQDRALGQPYMLSLSRWL